MHSIYISGSFLNRLPVIDSQTGGLFGQSGEPMQHFKPGELLAGLKVQLGEALDDNLLGDVCLSCWGG